MTDDLRAKLLRWQAAILQAASATAERNLRGRNPSDRDPSLRRAQQAVARLHQVSQEIDATLRSA